jgi:hypothetical protein
MPKPTQENDVANGPVSRRSERLRRRQRASLDAPTIPAPAAARWEKKQA